MKTIARLLLLICTTFVWSQSDLTNRISDLKNEIEKSTGVEKLKLLDSLTNLVREKPEYNYDSIAKVTIDLAVKEQDYNMAAKKTGELISFLVYTRRNPEEGLKLFESTLEKNWDVTDSQSLAVLYSEGAESYIELGFKKESIHYYEKAEGLLLKAKDSTKYARIKGYKAYVLSTMGEFATASQEYQKALSIFTRRDDGLNILKIRIGLSILYSQNRFYDEAEKEYFAIESLSLELEDYGAYLANLENMAYDYALQGEYAKSIQCNKRKLAVIEDHPELNFFTINTLQGLALNYIATDSLDKARVYVHKLKDLFDKKPESNSLKLINLKTETELFLAEGDLLKAEVRAKELLEMRQGTLDYENIMEVHKLLYNIYEAKKDEPQALKHFKVFTKIKDSIESVEKTRVLSYYQTLYETEKRDAKIESQQSEITILNAENKVNLQRMLLACLGLITLFITIYLFRSRAFAKKQQALQEKFSQDLITGQEEERSRIARELHDSVGQKLMLLSKTTKSLGSENAEQLASSTLDEVRSISRGLHPSNLERLGLTESINALVYNINANTELFFTDEIENIDNILSKESELHVYRIIQETLSNVVKHSEAKAVKMEVDKMKDAINIMVSDNGKGFDFESKYKSMSLGLKTLLERAKIIGAQLNLDSKVNKGTVVTLNIPI
ncbi:histidine kinase [Winogradskyella sp. 3972H.M.0a.05]|uniref:tetratricopeptide repeat-containing sensor histidine kinase n=1 Tax=Winogradskyella sp. 3972H.M.0a.05 TaxID=2950277 RepID=UPI00339A2471